MNRMKLWEEGRFVALITDMEANARLSSGGGTPQETDETIARRFNSKVLSGHLQAACRGLTNRDGGGVLKPTDVCTKTGEKVLDVLKSKHPELRDPTILGQPGGAFEPYPSVPPAVPMVISTDVVETIASKLSGSGGPSGTDAVALQNWLLRHKQASQALRTEMAALATWLASSNPPWAAIRALMASRLMMLDKQPGTRPVGIGEIWRRLLAKCVLRVAGAQATQACGNFNVCVSHSDRDRND